MSLHDPVTLPSGLTLPNRLSKAAMAESLAPQGVPDAKLQSPYRSWAEGGWGMILTGNVQVSRQYLGGPGDVSIPGPAPKQEAAISAAWREWSNVVQRNGTPGIVQINHPGRQSPGGVGTASFGAKRVAPSAVALQLGDGLLARMLGTLVFGTPRPLTLDEIRGPDGIVAQFVAAAVQADAAGFAGVELHAAHGYLLAQFMSPATNFREDAYGGTPAKRVRIVVEVLEAIRAATRPGFTVGIKLNSADHQVESTTDVIEQVGVLVRAGVDFIEVSGGSYENPRMAGTDLTNPAPAATSTLQREAYFLTFASELRTHFPDTVLMLTGGFRSRDGMMDALSSGAADLVGLGRPATVWPHLPKDIILNKEISDEAAKVPLERVAMPWYLRMLALPMVGAGFNTMYYGKKLAGLRG